MACGRGSDFGGIAAVATLHSDVYSAQRSIGSAFDKIMRGSRAPHVTRQLRNGSSASHARSHGAWSLPRLFVRVVLL